MAMADVRKDSGEGTSPATKRFHGRLKVDATFCPTDVADLFSTVEWEVRSAQIKDENGKLIFEQTNCEIPSSWSQLATNVVVSKYFYGERRHAASASTACGSSSTASRGRSPTGAWPTATSPSPQDGERFYRELTWLCLHQHGAFNSPVWFNVGLYPPVRRDRREVQLALGPRDDATSSSRRTRTSIRKARPASSRASTTTWKTSWGSPAARPCSSSSAPAPAPTFRRSARIARSCPAAASRAARCRSCGSTTRSRRW